MKFVILLSVIASSNLFAGDKYQRFIKCYESAQQNGKFELAYKFQKDAVNPASSPDLVYPANAETITEQVQDNEDGYFYQCMQAEDALEDEIDIRFCRGEGRRMKGLFPVEVTFIAPEGEDAPEAETVYCESPLGQWVFGIPKDFTSKR